MSKQLETRVAQLTSAAIVKELRRLASQTSDRREALELHWKANMLDHVGVLDDNLGRGLESIDTRLYHMELRKKGAK